LAVTEPSLLLLIMGLTILLGFIFNYVFSKTGIPDAIFLLVFGLLLGPGLKVIDPTNLLSIAPFFSQIALLIILMDGGIAMDLHEVLRGSFRATLLAVMGFALSVVSIAWVTVHLLGWGLVYGLLFGAIVGNPTPILVFYVVDRMKLEKHTSTVLRLEAIIAEIMVIVVALALLDSFMAPQLLPALIAKKVLTKFIIGGVLGLIIGTLWYFVLERLSRRPYSYMLTLAVAFIIFSVTENIGGSGPISALFFGLALGNEEHIARLFGHRMRVVRFDETMKGFHAEISFFIKALALVYLGLIFVISGYSIIIYGAIISLILFAARLLSVRVCTIGSRLKKDRGGMYWMVPRGLAPAVLSVTVLSFANQFPDKILIANAKIISELTFVVILCTILICTIGTYIYSRREIPSKRASNPSL